ncbi:MAG TPA: amidohydrolase family protein, partial [Firmicutes bacterium]|nr:amidohydrolase family protein [Bacillota bacterium]
ALELGTVAAGKAVFGEKVGSLEETFLADIVIMDYEDVPELVPGHNPVADLVYSTSQPKVATVIVNGDIVFDGGKCRYIDEEKALWEARSRAFKLVGRN